MTNILQLKPFGISFLAVLLSLSAICQAQSRQRNTIYVLDCTGSMNGYNGAPDIWAPTKEFLKTELQKEARENPDARVTVLPFQDKVHTPIRVDLDNISWPRLESVLDSYIKRITPTNICDSWLLAERYIDQSCDNYIVLLTDGHDNIGGSANEANRTRLLSDILKKFCGKYQNTKGFYVELTKAASLPQSIRNAIDICADLYKIDATGGIPSFGCASDDVIHVNSRDLPADITLGFSNAGSFNASMITEDNPYLNISIKDNKISQGEFILRVESKLDDDIEALNKAVGAPTAGFTTHVHSDDVTITNPRIDIVLHTTPLRSLDLVADEATVHRTKPFLWIKGNDYDTLRWNLKPDFNPEAMAEKSMAMFRLRSDKDLSAYGVQFNGDKMLKDSIIIIGAGTDAILDVIVPASQADSDFGLTLNEVSAKDLDRINGVPHSNARIILKGSVETGISIAEIVFWCIAALLALWLILWFGFIRRLKYPVFKRGIITIQSPYYGTIKVKGYRKIVFGPQPQKQSAIDRICKGAILYHTNQAWTCTAEVTPSGRNMRFRCPSGTLLCSPQPLLMKGMTFDIINQAAPASKIVININ